MGEYGLTLWPTHMSLFLLLHNVGIIHGTNKANRDKGEGMSMLNVPHETWDEEMLCEMELLICGKSNLLCISCIDDDVGQHMVVTWHLWEKEGHLTTQLEVTLCILERQLWNQTCITHCTKGRRPSVV